MECASSPKLRHGNQQLLLDWYHEKSLAMSKYIPPGRRQQRATSNPAPDPEPAKQNDLLSLEEINNHFWAVARDNEHSRDASSEGRTLHDAAAAPGKLAYVMLFSRANPRWDTEKIVFTKSNLDLLPQSLADGQHDTPRSGKENGGAADMQLCETLSGAPNSAEQAPSCEADVLLAPAKDTVKPNPAAVFKQVNSTE